MKKLLILLSCILAFPLAVGATATTWDYVSGTLQPFRSMLTAEVKGDHFTATSTSANNTFPNLITTHSTTTNATTTTLHNSGTITSAGRITAPAFTSTVSSGAPFSVVSAGVVNHLNSDLWDSHDFADYLDQAVKTTSDTTFNSVYANSMNVAQTGSYKLNGVTMISGADTEHWQFSDFIYGNSNANQLGINVSNTTHALDVSGYGADAIASFAGTSYGGGTIILRALDAFAWSGFNIYDENNAIAASFQYGNSGVSDFRDALVLAGRKTTTPVELWTTYDYGEGEGLYKRLTVAPIGNVGIGTSTPAALLEVYGGGLKLDPGEVTKPTCSATIRGEFWYTPGAAGVKDNVEVCAKDAANAYAWRTIY